MKGEKIRAEQIEDLRKARIEWVPVDDDAMAGAYAVSDLADPDTGEVLVEAAHAIDAETLEKLEARGVKTFDVIFPSVRRWARRSSKRSARTP